MGEVNKSFSSLSSLLSFLLVLFFCCLILDCFALLWGCDLGFAFLPPCLQENKNAEEQKTEEKKPEAKEEVKKPESQGVDKKEEESKDKTPPPPPEIVLKVFMHCEGCARKVRRCLKGFPGVDEVITDCKTHKVVVKGEKADPQKVLERVHRKSHRQVELISPIPKPPAEEKKAEEKEKPAPEEKKEEPKIITVILRVHMHCEACAQELKRRILKMKGVESAEPDLQKSEVSVKGVFDPAKLVEFVLKRTGKQAVIVKEEAAEKKEKAEEKKAGEEEKEKKKEEGKGEEKKEEKKKEGEGAAAIAEEEGTTVEAETKVVEMKRSEYQYYPSSYVMEMYAYPPQIFSDENPNACSIM